MTTPSVCIVIISIIIVCLYIDNTRRKEYWENNPEHLGWQQWRSGPGGDHVTRPWTPCHCTAPDPPVSCRPCENQT